MNSINNNVPSNKSQSSQPVEQLTALYSQIAADGYGPDHPWCLALAGVIASEEDTPRLGGCSIESDLVRQQAYEIEERIGNVAVLIEETLEKIDAMDCKSPDQRRAVNAASTFIQSAMENVQAVRSANDANLKVLATMSRELEDQSASDVQKLLAGFAAVDTRRKAEVLAFLERLAMSFPA